MTLKPGSRWKSAVCDTEVVVVRPPQIAVSLECGGHPMTAHNEAKPQGLIISPEHNGGSAAGKRFSDETTGLELLCTKGGVGSLALGGVVIGVKDAKKLPASD